MAVNVIEFLLLLLIVFGKFILPPILIIWFVMHAGRLWCKIRPMSQRLLLFVLVILPIMLCAQESPMDSYTPCAKATQHLNVPEDIHLEGPGEYPGIQRKLTFLFSQDGIDAYALQAGRWYVLLIFQDEKVRREQLRYAVGTGLISWMYFQSNLGRQNWKPIADLKYMTMSFSWLGKQVFLNYAEYFAPLECVSLTEFSNTMPSSLLGNYMNISPSTPLPADSLAYKAAIEMDKLQAEANKRATKEYWEKRKRESFIPASRKKKERNTMQLQKVESGLIVAIGYDAKKQELRVEFHKSKKQMANPVYSYTPFSPSRWAEFQSSQKSDMNPTGSVGRYFLANIKNDAALKIVRIIENESPKESEECGNGTGQ